MITESVIITSIICITILIIVLIIGYYSNKDEKEQKIKDIRSIVSNFTISYVTRINAKDVFNGNINDIINLIETIKTITY